VFYQGIDTSHPDGTMIIDFYADPMDYPTDSGATSYPALLTQYGWTICREDACNDVSVTDTRFLGVYRYGSGANSPRIVIGVNMMIESGQQTTLFVKNCGTLGETRTATPAIDGCRVLLPTHLEPHP
jgi:hypothetical protein